MGFYLGHVIYDLLDCRHHGGYWYEDITVNSHSQDWAGEKLNYNKFKFIWPQSAGGGDRSLTTHW